MSLKDKFMSKVATAPVTAPIAEYSEEDAEEDATLIVNWHTAHTDGRGRKSAIYNDAKARLEKAGQWGEVEEIIGTVTAAPSVPQTVPAVSTGTSAPQTTATAYQPKRGRSTGLGKMVEYIDKFQAAIAAGNYSVITPFANSLILELDGISKWGMGTASTAAMLRVFAELNDQPEIGHALQGAIRRYIERNVGDKSEPEPEPVVSALNW